MNMTLGKPAKYLDSYNNLPKRDFNEYLILRFGINAGNRLIEQILSGENPDPEVYFTYLEDDNLGNFRFKVHSRRDGEDLCIVSLKRSEEVNPRLLEA